MKFALAIAFLALSFSGFCREGGPSRIEDQIDVEVKAGYFFFTDNRLRRVYNRGGLDLQLAASVPLYRTLRLYGALEYVEKHGKSLLLGSHTSIRQIPVSLGLEYRMCVWALPWIESYARLAPQYFHWHVKSDTTVIERSLSESGIGVVGGAGLLASLTDRLKIDLFAEYAYRRVHPQSGKQGVRTFTVQTGGFVLGGGVVYGF